MPLIFPKVGYQYFYCLFQFYPDEPHFQKGFFGYNKPAFFQPFYRFRRWYKVDNSGWLSCCDKVPYHNLLLFAPDNKLDLLFCPKVQGEHFITAKIPVVNDQHVFFQLLYTVISHWDFSITVWHYPGRQDKFVKYIIVVKGLSLHEAAALIALAPKMLV